MNTLTFHYFHLMPWPYLPADFDENYDSAWVTLPNSIYDPVKGHALYNPTSMKSNGRISWAGTA